MSDEEIVLKRLKETLDVLKGKNVIGRIDFQIRDMVEDCIRVIEKQQKEIEELKDINKKLEARKYMLNAITGELTAIPIDNNYISKDKIKAKIEDLKENSNGDDFNLTNVIMLFKSLLEKE